METLQNIKKPTKAEQKTAIQSYTALAAALQQISGDDTEIEIEETKAKIIIPSRALKLLGDILKSMSEGKPISLVPVATEVTTQKAAEILGCSRPHLIKLLEEGAIDFVKVGKHRRIMFEDVMTYRQKMKDEQRKHIIEIMQTDEEDGLYNT
ncbi:excisionase family DNA-binding protein [Chryseobacterium koreense]|uniref:excisionase family DNA-binding protein n=1 Tax=Chryseobacterium koreense TaxID=232216 RepID=UPI0026ED4A6A|nr:excisionase family DNA-binding protein [Chryseobacterium koreense]